MNSSSVLIAGAWRIVIGFDSSARVQNVQVEYKRNSRRWIGVLIAQVRRNIYIDSGRGVN